jgi:hypothetical protein
VAADGLDCFLEALASLLRKTREKKAGMLSWADARDRSSFGVPFFWRGDGQDLDLDLSAWVFDFMVLLGSGGQSRYFFFFSLGLSAATSTRPISYDFSTGTGPEGRSRSRRPTDNEMAKKSRERREMKNSKPGRDVLQPRSRLRPNTKGSPGLGNRLCSGQSEWE